MLSHGPGILPSYCFQSRLLSQSHEAAVQKERYSQTSATEESIELMIKGGCDTFFLPIPRSMSQNIDYYQGLLKLLSGKIHCGS